MALVNSIFDDRNLTEKPFKLWKKKVHGFKPTQKTPTFSQKGYKENKKGTGEMSLRFFFIIENYLCYKRNFEDEKYSGVLDLKWSRAVFSASDFECFKYVLMIVKNKKLTKIYLEGEEEMNEWRKALKNICVFNDFHVRYQGVQEVGRGAYASVGFLFYFNFLNEDF